MSMENRIEQRGHEALGSPLWLGLLITAFLVVPVFFTPGVPLWVGIVSLTSLLPIVLGCTYLSYYIYQRVIDSDSSAVPSGDSSDTESDSPTPIDRLRHAYANGEISEETFEQRLELLLETEDIEMPQHKSRSGSANSKADFITE